MLNNKDVMLNALNIYSNNNIDFVDSILCSIGTNKNNNIASLDKKIINFLKNN